MKLLGFLFFIILPASLAGQFELAKINDPDGFVNIRSDKCNSCDVIDKLNIGDLFICQPSKEDWWLVQKSNYKQGYVHKSRITLIKDCSDIEINHAIFLGSDTLVKLVNRLINASSKGFNETYISIRKDAEDYETSIYNPLLIFISQQFCKNRNPELINKFISTLVTDKGSANESLPRTLAKCYICAPDLVIKYINKYQTDDRKFLISTLAFGFGELTYQEEDKYPNFKNLKDQLDNLLKARL